FSLEQYKPALSSFDQIDNDLKTVVDAERLRLQDLYVHDFAKAAELRHFRATHDLIHREARYPESLVIPLGVVIWVMIGESLMNMYFFSKGNDLGLLGGWFQALIVSLVNALLATGIGGLICMRYRLHCDLASRLIAWAALLSIVVPLLVFFNLAVAHYRDALS